MQTEMDKLEVIIDAATAGKPIGFCYVKSQARCIDGPVVRERRQLALDPEDPIRYNQRGEAYVIREDLALGEPRSFTLKNITEVSVAS